MESLSPWSTTTVQTTFVEERERPPTTSASALVYQLHFVATRLLPRISYLTMGVQATSVLAALSLLREGGGAQLPPLYYINLDRRPDRRVFMLKEFEAHSLALSFNLTRFPAIDGARAAYSDEQLSLFKHADFKGQYNENVLIANQLSHMGAWEALLESGSAWGVVLQDDATLASGFAESAAALVEAAPRETLVVWLGLHHFAAGAFSLPFPLEGVDYDADVFSTVVPGTGGHIGVAKWNPCSLGYVITRRGAQHLTAHFRSVGFRRATDNAMNDALLQVGRHYIARRILCTGHSDFMQDSDIFAAADAPSLAPSYADAYRQAETEKRRGQVAEARAERGREQQGEEL